MPEPVAILLDLSARRLHLLRNGETVATYPVAIGKPETPTPVGDFTILQKVMYPGGVFGTRWMHLGDGYGIHGTNQPELIGQMVSHGCVRMYNQDVEELYDQVPLGTPVHIVPAMPGAIGRPLTPTDRAPSWGYAPSPGEKTAGAKQAGTYTVVPGDSLWLIAQRFGTSVDELVRLNHIANPDQIEVGQTLAVPRN